MSNNFVRAWLAVVVTAATGANAADVSAQVILKRVRDTYWELKTFRMAAEVTVGLRQPEGWENSQTFTMGFAFVYPSRMRMELRDPRGDVLVIADGESTWVYLSALRQYYRMPGGPVHSDPNDWRSPSRSGRPEEAYQHVMQELLYRYNAFAGATAAKVVRQDRVRINGSQQQCYVVRIDTRKQQPPFESGRHIYTWWVDKDKFRVVREEMTNDDPHGSNPVEFHRTVAAVVEVNEPIALELFSFMPPAGATLVDRAAGRRSDGSRDGDQPIGMAAFQDLHRNPKGRKNNIAASQGCGLALKNPAQPGRYESDTLELAEAADVVTPVWTSTIPNARLSVRVATSRDKNTWSRWTLASDELLQKDVRTTVGKALKDLGGVRYIRYDIDIKPEVESELRGCIDRVIFVYANARTPAP